MFKKLCTLTYFSLVISGFLSAEIEYNIQDIGTLQTKASQAIALNNQGQILGWYNIDGTNEGKHFFVRNRDGGFHELPKQENGTGIAIDWKYLIDDGKAYGVYSDGASTTLYMWDRNNGVVKLGKLPGKEISKINNSGQVLIKCVSEVENGKSFVRPVIWHNGKITKLNGLEGNSGIMSEESYGFDMNNKGEVAGKSLTYLIYKNEIYKQIHAVKWSNGQAIDLHNKIPKTNESIAKAINDHGEVTIEGYLIKNDEPFTMSQHNLKKTDTNYFYNEMYVVDRENKVITNGYAFSNKFINDSNYFIWMNFLKIICVNDSGEILAQGKTIYGEEHAMFLTPVEKK